MQSVVSVELEVPGWGTGGPGNAFKVPDVRPHHERDDVVASQLYLKQK